jgi:hypothetical protein
MLASLASWRWIYILQVEVSFLPPPSCSSWGEQSVL